jgi:hypothetical protein
MDFLTTFEGVEEVDRALLTTKDKFLARVALYSLQSLKKIAAETGQAIEAITPQDVLSWIERDKTIQPDVDDREAFQMFFTQLVMSSLKPLQRIAADEESGAIGNLTSTQVVQWFEQDAKLRMAQGGDDVS